MIVNDDAGDIRQETAALGADAIEGQQGGGGDMQPLRSAAIRKPVSSMCLTGAAATWSRTTSAKPWKRRAQSWLIRAMVAVTSFTPRRSVAVAGALPAQRLLGADDLWFTAMCLCAVTSMTW